MFEAEDSAVGRLQRLLALRTFSGFARLPPSDLAVLAEHLRPRVFPEGSVLLHEGDPVPGFHMIVKGEVHYVSHGITTREFGPKEVVGGIAALARASQTATAVAADDTVTLELDADDLEDVFEDNFSIALAVLQSLARYHLALRLEMGPDCGYPPVDESQAPFPVGDLWLVERMSVLRRTLPFGNVSIEAIASLAQSAGELRSEAGATLWRAGDRSGANVTILSGVVRCQTEDGRHRFRFGAGSVAGAIDSMAQVDRWYTATAETKLVALSTPAEALIDFMEDAPALAMELLRLNARLIMALHDRLARRSEEHAGAAARAELPAPSTAPPP